MTFRICTIGCGAMATNYHGPSYAKYKATHEGTELVACCDLDEPKAARYCERFGFARYYTDLTLMLEMERPDAVCLVVPEELTAEVSCQVLGLGFPLIMEKPPGRTTEEIDKMIAAADATGAASQVAWNRRYLPLARELKRQLGALFPPGAIQHVRYDMTRVRRFDPDFSMTAIHGIDMVRFLAGADYEHIRFHYQPLPDLGGAVANVFMDCTLTTGTTAHLGFLPAAGVSVERVSIHAHDHTFYLHMPMWNAFDAPGRLQHLCQGSLVSDQSGTVVSDGGEGFEVFGFHAENASFFDDIRSGTRPFADLRNARQTVEVMQCMRERLDEYLSTGPRQA